MGYVGDLGQSQSRQRSARGSYLGRALNTALSTQRCRTSLLNYYRLALSLMADPYEGNHKVLRNCGIIAVWVRSACAHRKMSCGLDFFQAIKSRTHWEPWLRVVYEFGFDGSKLTLMKFRSRKRRGFPIGEGRARGLGFPPWGQRGVEVDLLGPWVQFE